MRESGRIWPVWARSLGAMIEGEAIVRFACTQCRRVYDVDLEVLATMRGRSWSLIDRTARCKASKCRWSGRFVAASARNELFLWLHGGEPTPAWFAGSRPTDHEPPNGPPPPPGVDAGTWAYADERERRRLVRLARG